MSIINHELAFDLQDLTALRDSTETVREDLLKQKQQLKDGLDQLRTDWNTNAGRYFFEQLDENWEDNVTKFEATLDVFKEVLTDAIEEFQKVVDKAETLKFGPTTGG